MSLSRMTGSVQSSSSAARNVDFLSTFKVLIVVVVVVVVDFDFDLYIDS